MAYDITVQQDEKSEILFSSLTYMYHVLHNLQFISRISVIIDIKLRLWLLMNCHEDRNEVRQ
jgi:putative salt-induced outer membrane protein YdiY